MMRSLMRTKIAEQREFLQTHLTLKRFLTGVNEEMILQVGLFGKATRTDRTTVRPSAVVNVFVTTQITGCGETL